MGIDRHRDRTRGLRAQMPGRLGSGSQGGFRHRDRIEDVGPAGGNDPVDFHPHGSDRFDAHGYGTLAEFLVGAYAVENIHAGMGGAGCRGKKEREYFTPLE